LPAHVLRDVVLRCQALITACWSQMLAAALNGQPAPDAPPDRLLTARQVADRLGYHVNYVYAHRHKWPFTIHTPGQRPRFSERGLEAWMKEQQGA
jgi:hypothetical protein